MKKTVIISATTNWKLEDILNCLVRGYGWKGFHAGLGSKDGKVAVTVTVSRHLTSQSSGRDNTETSCGES